MIEFKVGDRVLAYHHDLVDEVRGRFGTVTKVHDGRYGTYVFLDEERGRQKNPTKDGWAFSGDHLKLVEPEVVEPTDEEVAELFKLKRDIHFLHPEARDIAFDGMAALCDWMNCLDEQPRVATESSVLPEEVTCQDCLNFMSRLAYVWQDGVDDSADWHAGESLKVPRNPYWGDGS